ncbi:iron-containing redox enzyme family protein [Bradyrhizobium sp. UFLA05-112]
MIVVLIAEAEGDFMRAEYIEDLGVDPETLSSSQVLAHLANRVDDTFAEIKESAPWRLVADDSTPVATIIAILKEIYLEIVMYQPDSLAAALWAIGQMPRSMPIPWVEEMLHHQSEEFDHNEMALRDYKGFGGNEEFARSRRMSPSSFAIAGVWNYIALKRDPFVYLGAVYLFDALTPLVTEEVRHILHRRGLSPKGLEFIDHHATADIEHAQQIGQLIRDVAERYPESRASICYGFEYFHHVYPMPAWNMAYRRAIAQRSMAVAAE